MVSAVTRLLLQWGGSWRDCIYDGYSIVIDTDAEHDCKKRGQEVKHGRNKRVKGGESSGPGRGSGASLEHSFLCNREPGSIGT